VFVQLNRWILPVAYRQNPCTLLTNGLKMAHAVGQTAMILYIYQRRIRDTIQLRMINGKSLIPLLIYQNISFWLVEYTQHMNIDEKFGKSLGLGSMSIVSKNAAPLAMFFYMNCAICLHVVSKNIFKVELPRTI